jgi:hypothetical protein
MEKTCDILHARSLPKFLWVKITNTLVHVLNHMTTRMFVESTHYEQWIGNIPNISCFRVFGCFGFKHVLRELQTQLDLKAQQMIFIGYVKYNMGYQRYNPSGRKITTATTMELDERASTNELHLNTPNDLK